MATRKSTRKSAAKSQPTARSRKPAVAKRATPAKAAKPAARPRRQKPESLRLRSITPGMTCGDLEKSIEFYVRGLGFVVREEWVRNGKRVGAMLRAGTCELGLGQDDWAKGRKRKKGDGSRLYLETAQDVDVVAERVRATGATLTAEPSSTSWAAREFSVDDPDGFHLTVFKALPKKR